ncbi:LuxR C-terminal-related transcriptional regulator [Rhodovastum atsumiense]|nr:response regulator transcription factor [Rhodovastum atsumiense]
MSITDCARVFVISDIRLLQESVVVGLSHSDNMNVIGWADSTEGPARVATERPDVVLLDAGASNGFTLPPLLRRLVPGLCVVVFGVASNEADIMAWAEAGASGYVARNGSGSDLIAAVKAALRGEISCSARVTGRLFARIAELSERRYPNETAELLTTRERQVMSLVEQGLSNKEIARELGIGPATVKNHIHRILRKLRARGRGEAAARLRRHGEALSHSMCNGN